MNFKPVTSIQKVDSENVKVKIKQQFQNFIYSMNFPFRGNQSAFTNLSVLDEGFCKALFKDYIFPDFSEANIKSSINLSKLFFEYFTEINGKEGIFTFPVMTLAISLDDKNEYIDKEFVDWAAKANCKKSLANIFQSKAQQFSSCCRMLSDLEKVSELGYQNSFGVGGLSIGSHRVAGLNLPRIALLEKENPNVFEEDLELLHKILYAHRQLIKERIKGGYLPLYDSNWINLNRQYSTIGFIGSYEYVKNKGFDTRQKEGLDKLTELLKKIETKIIEWQIKEQQEKTIYNLEQIPGESLCVKLCQLDTLLGFNPNNYKLYSNQYIPLVENASIYDRLKIQGQIDNLTSGGAILHINVDDEKPIDENQFRRLMDIARKTKTAYFAINYAFSECVDGHFSIGKSKKCPVCNKDIKIQYTRVVGFLTPVQCWNETRRDYEFPNRYFYHNGELEV